MVMNVNEPYGAAPVTHTAGSSNLRADVFSIPRPYVESLVPGDLVKLSGEGHRDGKVAEINLWEQSDPEDILGVLLGFSADYALQDDNGNHGLFTDSALKKYYPANTDEQWYANVITDPDCLLKMRVTSGAFTPAMVGLNVDVTARAPRLNAYPVPGFGLDMGTAAAAAALPLTIVRASDEIGNVPTDPFAEIFVRINRHARRVAKAGI